MIPLATRPTCARVGVFHLAAAVIFGCTALGVAQPAGVVLDTYITLSLPGVVGDFTAVPNAPGNSIQVLALSTGASCPGTSCRANVSDLSITKQADSASPKLFLAVVTNVFYPTAVINFWQAPTTGTNYTKTFTIYLTHAKLTSFQNSASEGSGPAEFLSLGFTTIAFQDNVSGSIACYNVSTMASANALTC